jgi:hypothetical protein
LTVPKPPATADPIRATAKTIFVVVRMASSELLATNPVYCSGFLVGTASLKLYMKMTAHEIGIAL